MILRRVVFVVALGALASVNVACGDDGQAAPADASPPAFEPYPPGAPAVSWFTEVDNAGGIVAYHLPVPDDMSSHLAGNGLAIGDIDNDGDLDVIATIGGGPAAVFSNQGSLSFADVSASAGLDDSFRAVGVALADMDGDGDLDCLLGGGAGTGSGAGSLRLFDNDGTGVFSDVTSSAGLFSDSTVHSLLVHDFDGDGHLDIYACRVASTRAGIQDQLYRSRGDGTYEDISARVGLVAGGYCWTAAALDFDADGDADLYVGNDQFVNDTGERPLPPPAAETFPDFVYRNDGLDIDGYPIFVEVGASSDAVAEPRSNMGILVGDFNGDDVTDVYVSDYGRNELLTGDGSGGFADTTDQAGLALTTRVDGDCAADNTECLLVSWGSALADFDQDGYDDLVAVNSRVELGVDKRQPVGLFRGTASGLQAVQTQLGWLAGRALLPADLDGDGDLDLVITTWEGPVRLFENTSNATSFAGVRLCGGTCGIGAELRVSLDDGRTIVRRRGSGGVVHSFGHTDILIGLGTRTITSAQLRWPGGAVTDVDLVPGSVIDVTRP